ncbi:unnamed protein product [Microthlaspi erraticum]|uniref:DUF4283 domain-containing protein n=1 Tax=Microthlaspi erraticum TaxID=1685480 RepID=A0A6D2HXP9_9BRAS|nr:unnamed protein product [Microthlaspi erraticum]
MYWFFSRRTRVVIEQGGSVAIWALKIPFEWMMLVRVEAVVTLERKNSTLCVRIFWSGYPKLEQWGSINAERRGGLKPIYGGSNGCRWKPGATETAGERGGGTRVGGAETITDLPGFSDQFLDNSNESHSMELPGGVNIPNFRRSVRYMLKKSIVDVLAFFETHAGGDRAGRICRNLGFENSFRVDDVGQSGGCGVDGQLVIGGDFNTIVRVDESEGGSGRLSLDSVAFGDWIQDLSLIDMGFNGNKYTWRRGRCENSFVAKRLDRVLCSVHARLKWQEAKKKKEQLLNKIKEVQEKIKALQTDALLARDVMLLKEFDGILEQEEVIWYQKSREKQVR